MNIFTVAIKNLKRKIGRTVVLLLSVTLVTGTLFFATLFILSMQNALKIGTYRLGADILVVPEKYESQARSALLAGEPTSFYIKKDILEKIKGIEGVKNVSPQLFIKPASFSCCYNVDVFLIGFDPETDFTVLPWLKTHMKEALKDNEVITGREVPVIENDNIPFYGTIFKVKGTMEPTGMNFFDKSVFMTIDAAYKMAENSKKRSIQPIEIKKDEISAVLVQVKEGYTPDRVSIKIEHDIPGVKAIASDEIITTVRRHLKTLLKGIITIGGILWLFSLLMMGFAFYMIVNERQKEIGLLRSMGARKKDIFRLIVTEALDISLIGGLTGLFIATVSILTFKKLLLHSLKLPYLLPSIEILFLLIIATVLFSLTTGIISSFIPAYLASNLEPYNAIRKGE